MVSDVDVAGDKFSRFRICSRNDEILTAHEVPLEAGRYQAIDVL